MKNVGLEVYSLDHVITGNPVRPNSKIPCYAASEQKNINNKGFL